MHQPTFLTSKGQPYHRHHPAVVQAHPLPEISNTGITLICSSREHTYLSFNQAQTEKACLNFIPQVHFDSISLHIHYEIHNRRMWFTDIIRKHICSVTSLECKYEVTSAHDVQWEDPISSFKARSAQLLGHPKRASVKQVFRRFGKSLRFTLKSDFVAPQKLKDACLKLKFEAFCNFH